MTCEEFLELLDQDHLEESAEAAAHAQECASCRAALERWQVVRHEFTSMRDEPAPPFLHTRVMAHVQGAPPERRNWFGWLVGFRPTWATTLLVLVLGIAIGGLGVWRWRWRPVPASAPGAPPAQSDLQPRRAAPGEAFKREAPPKPEPAGPEVSRFPALEQLPTRQAPEESRGGKDQKPEREKAVSPPAESGTGELAPPPARAPAARAPEGGSAATPPIFEGAATEAAPEASAPPEPKPAVRDASPAPGADESALVVCTLKSLDQGSLSVLQLPLEAAPPPSAAWSIIVGGDGGMAVLDAFGAKVPRPHPELMGVLAAQRLAPGRYLLKRVG